MTRLLGTMLYVLLALPATRSLGAIQGDDCMGVDQTPTVISAAEIERSGVIRLTDLFRLMPDWHTISTDGYLWDVAPGAFALPEWDGLTLMIDGQPLGTSILGQSYLNAYPLDVGLIDSLVVFEGPVLCRGTFAGSGLVSIHTRREHAYGSAGASGALANETGDPGPFRYTDLDPPNIDRSGPVLSAFGAVSGRKWHARVAGKWDEHHVTDTRLLPRVRRLYKNYPPPRDFLGGRRADVKIESPAGEFTLTAEETRLEHFEFMPTVGSEVPLSLHWIRGGASGRERLYRAASFFFAGEYSLLRFGHYPSTPYLDLDWRERRGRVHGGVLIEAPLARFGAGFSAYGTWARGERPMVESEIRGNAWFFTMAAQPMPNLGLSAWGRIAREDTRAIRSAVANVTWSPFRALSARIGLSTVELPAHETANFFFWTDRGLAAPSFPDMTPAVPTSRRLARRISGSGGLHWSPVAAVSLSATATLAGFSRFPLVKHAPELVREVDIYLFDLVYFDVETMARPETSGRTHRLAFEAALRPFSSLTARLYYAYTVVHTRDEAFRVAWSAVPRHRGYASVTFAPFDRLSVHARISHESWSYWPDYQRVAGATNYFYTDRLPVLGLLDVAVTKRFWFDNVVASALVTNVLNRHFQRHPAGAAESISLLARVQIHF